MTLLSTTELTDLIERYQGGNRILSATMLCPLKMNKTHRETREPNPWMIDGESAIDHLQERVVCCGADYSNMVNNAWSQAGVIPAFQARGLWEDKNGVPQGRHINRYLAEHIKKGTLYLCLYFAKIRQGADWIENSLKQEAWLDRFTGLEFQPDWNALAPYLPPKAGPSISQGCRDGADIDIDIDGETHTVKGGSVRKQIEPRYPHLENVLLLRSWDLENRGDYDVIQVKRSRYQISL